MAFVATAVRRRRSAAAASVASVRAFSSARSRIWTLAPPSLVTTRSMRRARLCESASISSGSIAADAPFVSRGVAGSGPVTIVRNSGKSILPFGAMPTRAMARSASSTVAFASPSTRNASRTRAESSAPDPDSSTRLNISPIAEARALVTSGRDDLPRARSQSATSAGLRRTIESGGLPGLIPDSERAKSRGPLGVEPRSPQTTSIWKFRIELDRHS